MAAPGMEQVPARPAACYSKRANVQCVQHNVLVKFRGDHGVLQMAESSRVEDLHTAIFQRFPDLKTRDFVVKYKDDEGDWITVVTTSDLQQALEFLQASSEMEEKDGSLSENTTLELFILLLADDCSVMSTASTASSNGRRSHLSGDVFNDSFASDTDLESVTSYGTRKERMSTIDVEVNPETVPKVLQAAVQNIPKEVAHHCPIARIFGTMVKSLMSPPTKATPNTEANLQAINMQTDNTTVSGEASVASQEIKRDVMKVNNASALAYITSMGFTDQQKIIKALDDSDGDVNTAVEKLLENTDARKT